MFVLSYLMANHFPWTYRWRPDLALDWQRPRQQRRRWPPHRRISAPAGDQRARLQGLRRAAQARLSRRAVPDRALRRPSAVVRQAHRRSGARQRRDRPPDRCRRSALLHHLLRHRRAEFPPGGHVVGGRAASTPPTCRWSFWRRRACRSMLRLPSRSAFSGRCNGLFYLCANGAEARRFNRLLIDAGMIKRL